MAGGREGPFLPDADTRPPSAVKLGDGGKPYLPKKFPNNRPTGRAKKIVVRMSKRERGGVHLIFEAPRRQKN